MHLEYFQSQKYHEALLIFQRLDQSYKLNARYKAYIGLCYYYDWDYKKATEYFDPSCPNSACWLPRSGRSTIMRTGRATSSWATTTRRILLFQSALALCHDRDKGDSWFRFGFCYYFLQQPALAQRCFLVAEYYYATFRNSPDLQARRQQMAHMMRGLRPEIVLKPLPDDFLPTPPRVAYRLSQDRGRHVALYSFCRQALTLPQTEPQPPVGEPKPQQEEPQQEENPQQKEKHQAEKQQQAEKPQQAEPQQEEQKAID